MKRIKTPIFVLIVILLASFIAVSQSKVEAFDQYASAAAKTWEVPGMSVVVVQDGKVLLSKGYGSRELGKNQPVDSKTLFGAMSTTKAMTAVAMGMLVDEVKVNWNDNVVDHLPDFATGDPFTTSQLKVRDLFTHNTGIPSVDILWAWSQGLSSDELLKRMRLSTPTYPLRGGFVYHNLMYLAAGKVIEKVSGMPWDRFMTERVFRPLGMNNTFPTLGTASSYQNRSSAHFEVKGQIRVIPDMNADTIGPAGSVWTTADDAAIWMNFMLGNGTYNGKTLLKPATMNEMFKPQVIIPATFYPSFQIIKPRWTTYGLGWFQHDYRGEKVDFHTGSLAGRTAIVGMIRDKKLGVYIFGNLDHAEVRHALIYKVFDIFGFDDVSGRDWSADLKVLYDKQAEEGAKQTASQIASGLKNTNPTHPLEKYAGRYGNPFFGTAEVVFENGKLHFQLPGGMTAELQHRQLDTFVMSWKDEWRGQLLGTFNLSAVNGDVVSLTIGTQTLRRMAAGAR